MSTSQTSVPRLRPATAADAPRLSEVAQAAYRRYVERMGRPPRPMIEDYADVVRQSDVTVAEVDGAIAGFVALKVDHRGFLVDNVAVHPEHHGTGVGRALLRHAEVAARRAGRDEIYLFTHETMTENVALYRRIGYVVFEPPDAEARLVYLRKPLR